MKKIIAAGGLILICVALLMVLRAVIVTVF